jgi:UPF0042 nucleotide-binding protein
VLITSFGFLHGAPPAAHLLVDLRFHFRDPHVDPGLRYLTAEDERVRRAVLGTSGIPALLDGLEETVVGFETGPVRKSLCVAVGCAGGRHRAATVAQTLCDRLSRRGIAIQLVHRDLHRPVVDR